jgi:hypothetical protein
MPQIECRYPYLDDDGTLLFEVERLLPKGFRQRRPDANGGWIYDLQGVKRVLWRQPQVRSAIAQGQWVAICEGEKDAQTVSEHSSLVASTAPGGAGKWRDEFTSVLRGGRVVLIGDADEAGRRHTLDVARRLAGVVRRLVVLEPPIHKDVSEHVQAGLSLKQLQRIDWRARIPRGADHAPKIEVLSAKQIMAIPPPSTDADLLGPLLHKGQRVVLGGHTGAGKTSASLWMVAAAVHGTRFLQWDGRGGLRALVIDAEQGTETIQRRIAEVGLQDSEQVQFLRMPDGLALDSDSDAVAQMERILRDGRYDLVLADPLYKLGRGDLNDARAAVNLMRRFDDWRERYDFALLLPMHCRKPHPNSSLSVHDLFGSSGFQWGAEILLGLERKTPGRSLLHFWKDRDGRLGPEVGARWVLSFDRDSGYQVMSRGDEDAGRFNLRAWLLRYLGSEHANEAFSIYQLRDALRSEQHDYKVAYLERVLGALPQLTITSEPYKKDRLYSMQGSLFPASAMERQA